MNPLQWNWILQLALVYNWVQWIGRPTYSVLRIIPETWGTPEFSLVTLPALIILSGYTVGLYAILVVITTLQPPFESFSLRAICSILTLVILWGFFSYPRGEQNHLAKLAKPEAVRLPASKAVE